MHVIFRESHGLEETDTPTDLGQSPADLVVLSFSDSDLGAFAEGWHRGGGPEGRLPGMRLANLVALGHPLSVDTYVERTLSGARGILIRLIGGVPYWSYGLQQVRALAERNAIALAVLPADGRDDARLDAMSTVPVSTLRRLQHLCDTGGAVAAQAALAQMALASGLYAGPVRGARVLPQVGAWTAEHGVSCPAVAGFAPMSVVAPVGGGLSAPRSAGPSPPEDISGQKKPRVLVVFYRSYLVAADLDPVAALTRAFTARGYEVLALFAPSLKAPEVARWLARQVARFAPDAIVNATAFSGKGDDGTSPLDAGGVPVFQVALATATREAWDGAERGLSPADLAMHVVLPEVDGRIMGGVASFKEPGARDPDLQFARYGHRAAADRIAAIVARVEGWVRLARRPVAARRPALILSTYPGKDWNAGHAVGLDAPASARAILEDLRAAGYDVGACPEALEPALLARGMTWPLAAYRAALARLPQCLQADLHAAWGDPAAEAPDGQFRFAAVQLGTCWWRCSPSAARPRPARRAITTCRARRGTPMWRSISGCRSRPTRSSISARMARWNGCRANPWPCRRSAGPRF